MPGDYENQSPRECDREYPEVPVWDNAKEQIPIKWEALENVSKSKQESPSGGDPYLVKSRRWTEPWDLTLYESPDKPNAYW